MDTPLNHRLSSRWLWAARVAWLALFAFSVAVFVVAVPARYAQLLSPEDEVREGLARLGYSPEYIQQYGSEAATRAALSPLGLSPASIAAYLLALDVAVALVYLAVALVIVWRKSDSPMGLFASLFLTIFGIGGSSYVLTPLGFEYPILTATISALAYSLLPLFFYLFPDGRLVPRRGWILAVVWAITTFFWNFAPRSPWSPTNWPLWLYLLYLMLLWGSTVLAQIYRYWRVSSAAQRQQTKWLVFGFGLMVLLFFTPIVMPASLGPGAEAETLYSVMLPIQVLGLSVIPIAIAISILRYRLWEIDLLIRRTLQYSILSVLLALTYFGSVIILQSLVGQRQSQAITVLSTLAIAALFLPLRQRVQAFIDRRFYRRKYDAQKVLAAFAATARDETDLDKLTTRLTDVVQATMQPESVSLWLKPASPHPFSRPISEATASGEPGGGLTRVGEV